MKNKNILFVCASIGKGGAERAAVNFANELSKNHEIHLVYFHAAQDSYTVNQNVHLNHSASSNLFSKVISLVRYVKKYNIEVIISFTDVQNTASWLARYFLNKDTVHISSVQNDLRERDKLTPLTLKHYVLKKIHRLALRGSTLVVTCSAGVKTSLMDYYDLQGSKIVTIYNPVLRDSFIITNHSDKSDLCHPKILAAGRLSPQKNYPVLINACKLLRDSGVNFHLDIYGEGVLENQIKELIKSLSLEEYVRLLGFDKNLTTKMADYDIFVLSSDYEGMGNVLVEALAANLRVVSTNCNFGPTELLDNGKFGYLSPTRDSRLLSESIQEAVHSALPFSQDELKQHLHQFTNSFAAKKLLHFINEIVP